MTCNCGGNCAQSRYQSTTGRFATEPSPVPTTELGRGFDNLYDVQAYTGYPTSVVPAGQWNRGILYRQAQPALLLTSTTPMYDPTDPRTWGAR